MNAVNGQETGEVSRISELRSLGIETHAHERVIIEYLIEFERKTVANIIWFAEKYPMVFCARKSAVGTYVVLERASPEEFRDYVEFLRNFDAGYEPSKKMAWSIVGLLAERKGFDVDIPAGFASPEHSEKTYTANPVLVPEIVETVRTASVRTETALNTTSGATEKRLSEALFKRLRRRYDYLVATYVIRGSGEKFDEKELSKELFGFMQGHISGNRALMMIPRFEDMGASVDDSTEGLSFFHLLLRKYADAGHPLSVLRSWIERKKLERSDAEGLAYARFFLWAINDADERKGVENRRIRDAREELRYLRNVLVRTVSRIDEIVASLGTEER